MKSVFILEENDVEELIKNANVTMAILDTVLREDKVDQITREQLIHAKAAVGIVNDILGK